MIAPVIPPEVPPVIPAAVPAAIPPEVPAVTAHARAAPARSTAIRLGALIAGVFAAANVAAFGSAYAISVHELRARARADVLSQMATFVEVHQSGGIAAVASQIVLRAKRGERGPDLVFLSPQAGPGAATGPATGPAVSATIGTTTGTMIGPPMGERAAGNVRIERTFTGWRTLAGGDLAPASGVELSREYLAYGASIDGHALIVGQSTDALHELAGIFARAFVIGLALSTALSAVATLVFVRRAEARIAAIAGTLDAVAAGAYERRVPVWAQRSDDLGRIAVAINATLDRLAANVSGLKQVSADIAHDLKTPIQRLRATLERMRDAPAHEAPDVHDGRDTSGAPSGRDTSGAPPERDIAGAPAGRDIAGAPPERGGLDDAIDQTDAIVRTFQALLRIAQIEGGSPRARFQPTDMAEICAAVAEAFHPAIEDAGHSFAVRLAPGPLMVDGDRDLLAQALSNLLENAIRHAPAPSAIALALERAGGDAVACVSDTGPGIAPEDRGRVFQRLYRLERSRTSEGSGLGLALVAAVCDLHRARVTLEDAAPGLRAVLRLPLIGDERA
jgi:signal transduction histidine kinase